MTYEKSVLKKYRFLLIVPVAILLHLLVTRSGIEGPDKGTVLILIWGCCIVIIMYNLGFYKSYIRDRDNFLNADIDVDLFAKITKKRAYLEKFGKSSVAKITKVSKARFGYDPLNPACYVVEYKYYDEVGNEFIGLKGLYDTIYNFYPSIPVVDDKIKIIYDKSNPKDSIITHVRVDKVPWYKLQKKYEIKIITNLKN